MEFHISRAVREAAKVDDILFSYTGNVVFANVAASRKLAEALNQARKDGARGADAGAINAGALFAMGLIDELSHALVDQYRKQIDPAVLAEAVRWFAERIDSDKTRPGKLEALLLAFTEQFPNAAVFRGKLTAAAVAARLNRRPAQPRGRAGRAADAVDRQQQPRIQALPVSSSRTSPEAADRLRRRDRGLPRFLQHAPAHGAGDRQPLRRAARADAGFARLADRPARFYPRELGALSSATTSSASCWPSTCCAKRTSPSGCASIPPAPTSSATARLLGRDGLRGR